MIGETLECRARTRDGTILWLLVAIAGWGVAAATQSWHGVVFSLWPISMIAVRLVRRSPVSIVTIEETGLAVSGGDDDLERFIEYERIHGLRLGLVAIPAAVRGPHNPLEITHADGILVLRNPDRLYELFQFLLARTPLGGSRAMPDKLKKHLDEQLTTFDDDLVMSYRARFQFTPPRPFPEFALGTAITAVAWCLSGCVVPDGVLWAVIGITLIVSIGVFAVVTGLGSNSPRAPIKDIAESALVISPWGIAMKQGDLTGRIHWDEIRALEPKSTASFRLSGAASPGGSIQIIVAGATIAVADIYDRPLAQIYDQMKRQRRPEDYD